MIEFGWGAATDTGRSRKNNQDRMLVSSPMFVVADGMGGHQAGEVAALMAVEHLADNTNPASLDDFVAVVEQANEAIFDRATDDPTMRGMGTTVVAMAGIDLADGPAIGVVNVGDSRLYRLASESLVQITEDHSLVETLVRDGRLTREEAAVHPQRNILTRALGIDRRVLADSWMLTPVVGDRYLLCSDGLFNELSAGEIHSILDRVDPPDVVAETLVSEACAAGGHDNVTVVVVDILGVDEPTVASPDRVAEFRPALPTAERRPPVVVTETSDNSGPVLTWRLALFVGSVLAVMIALMVGVVGYARSGYFVGIDGPEVVIYKGRPNGVLWFDPTVEEPVKLTVAALTPADLADVRSGITFDSLDAAKRYGFEMYTRAENQP